MKDSAFERATEGKLLHIAEEFDAPELYAPTENRRAIVTEDMPYLFEWQKNEEADYYRFRLYKGNGGALLFDENFITDDFYELDMSGYEEGLYSWDLQAFAYEDESSSRRASLLSSTAFVLRKIYAVNQLEPKNGAVFEGLSAYETPPKLIWKSEEPCKSASITLTQRAYVPKDAAQGTNAASAPTHAAANAADDDILMRKELPQNGYNCQLEPLLAGTYEWKITAFTYDDLDISSTESFFFTVLPIPPFEAPENARTPAGTLFDARYLKATPFITFSWDKVMRAQNYILRIYGADGAPIFTKVLASNETNYKLESISLLSKGDFNWDVRAVRLNKDGSVFIDGKPANGSFSIDFSIKSNGGKRKNTGELYGQ